MTTLIGKTIGRYRFDALLGRGGMADVYKGYQTNLDRYVAIKVLHTNLAEGEEFLARFDREAKSIASLRHPNILQIYDFNHDETEDIYYIVMELVEGDNLKQRLKQLESQNRSLPLVGAIRIFNQVGSALEYAHQRDIIHRDVKPENIMVEKSGRVFLADFGVARMMSGSKLTITGTLVGTPAYMSPEQAMGLSISFSSDIYSLGIVLYEMVTGKVPFEADTPFGLIHKHVNEPPPPPLEAGAEIPEEFESIILKSLAKKPEDRYSSVATMMAAVEEALSVSGVLDSVTTPIDADATIGHGHQTTDHPISLQAEEIAAAEETKLVGIASPVEPPETNSVEDIEHMVTEVWEPDDEKTEEAYVDMEHQPTEVWEPETEESEVIVTEDAEPEFRNDQIEQARMTESVSEQGVESTISKQGKEKKRFPILPAALVGVAVITIILLVALLSSGHLIGRSTTCESIDVCIMEMDQAAERGDHEQALLYLDQALRYAEGEEHLPFAHLWCRRGELNTAIDNVPEAIQSYERCIEWTGEDPDLLDLRSMAENRIRELVGD